MIDRYEAAGLTRNPFCVEAVDATSVFVDRGLADPPGPGCSAFVQVIGESGAGKSTHVRHWQRRHPGPYHWVPREPYRSRWAELPLGDMVYGDEIDRLPVPLRSRWFRRLAAAGSTLVIGTHVDLSRLAKRSGFRSIETHHVPELDASAVADMARQRIAISAVTGKEARAHNLLTDDEIAQLADRSSTMGEATSLLHQAVAAAVLNQNPATVEPTSSTQP